MGMRVKQVVAVAFAVSLSRRISGSRLRKCVTLLLTRDE
jgi:hypothetical protein